MRVLEEYPYLETLSRVLLKKLDKKDLTIVDVGAFDGVSCVLLKRGFRDATIYAIEPCPVNYKVLVKRVKHYENIIPCRVAISDTNGKEYLYIITKGGVEETSSQSNSLFKQFVRSKSLRDWRKASVITQTLSSFCKCMKIGQIDLLKLNCEGGEYKIFDNKSSYHIFDRVSIINLTLHGKIRGFLSQKYRDKRTNINDFLVGKGFRLMFGKEMITRKMKGHISQIWAR